MPRYAVSHIDWLDHDLTTIIVEATDWQSALIMHPKADWLKEDIAPNTTLEECKQIAFDCDSMIHVEPVS